MKKGVAELAAEGYRGKALSDALYKEMFGVAPPKTEPTAEERQQAWQEFWAIQDSLSDEELAQDIFCGRPTNTSILDDDSVPNAHSA